VTPLRLDAEYFSQMALIFSGLKWVYMFNISLVAILIAVVTGRQFRLPPVV